MAVNSGWPHPHKGYGRLSGDTGSDQGANASVRSRTASPESGRASPTIFNPFYTGRPRTSANGSKTSSIDRREIIKRIKSNGSRPTSPELEKSSSAERQDLFRLIKGVRSRPASPELPRGLNEYESRWSSSQARPITPTEPDTSPKSPEIQQDNEVLGLQIERPHSAFHRGDFRQKEQEDLSLGRFSAAQPTDSIPLSTSPVVPWHPQFPSTTYNRSRDSRRPSLTQNGIPIPTRPLRDRAVSNASLAASFVYKPPTSPLVQSSRPDTPELSQHARSPSPDKSRRHTFSPQSFVGFRSALDYPASARNSSRAVPPLRSGKTFPYQAHQPRRSLNTTAFSSLPHTPSSRSRRPSISADSPLHHAPMVGSYEESILRGRMSTIPSRPLNFMAQIGVLGKGPCKASLRCPPHVSVGFPAVFYSYGSGTKNPTSDQPSPYVGLVDLENDLVKQDDLAEKCRHRRQEAFSDPASCASSPRGVHEVSPTSDLQARRRRKQKATRRSDSPRAPPGGSYRIPQQGQLQIVIKNPNKTAVKLFLIPYDLSEMEAGQKTFIRQRSYSAGPIIDMPLSSRKNLGTDRPEAAINATGDPNDRPTLRYLIHLHICCPSKGRYFLYKSIRVVFANRVPDGKEKLRNEIQLPDPVYSVYKPSKDSAPASNSQGQASQRATSEFDRNNGNWPVTAQNFAQSLPQQEASDAYSTPMPTLPRHFTTLPIVDSRPSSRQYSDRMDVDSLSPSTSSALSPVSSNGDQLERAGSRSDETFTFQRSFSRDGRAGGRSESILSRRLMDLAFQHQMSRQVGDEV